MTGLLLPSVLVFAVRGALPPAAACAAAERPSIVLVSIDALRSDRLPVDGDGRLETPAIDVGS